MNVILVSHSIIPSVLLCGHAQLEHLRKQELIDYRFVRASKVRSEDLSWADIVVFVRSESYLEEYAASLAKGKRHLVYVLDDDLLNLPSFASSSKYYNIPSIHNNIVSIMKNCETFLTPSKVLLEKYGKDFSYADNIDEPSLNCIEKTNDNKKVKIGFAGSIDRTQDINTILEGTLEEILEKYKDQVDIEFMGAKPEIVDKYKLNYIPYQDSYKKYTKKMGELNWDIGLAPMPISDFHSCKYFNKYVEYASFGIAGIYTNCKPYIYGINDKKNGLLVNNNKEEWVEALSLLIENKDLREAISKQSIKEANTIYSLDTLSKQFYERITYGYEPKEKEDIVITKTHRIEIFIAMVKDKIMIQRWRFPFWCVKYMLIKLFEAIGIMKKKDNNNDWEE